MYRLKVKINNIWRDLDLGDDKPAMNYKQNSIGEMQNRMTNYSHKLRLPLSSHNMRVFGFINYSDTIATEAYKYHECRLLYDDFELAGIGSLLRIVSVDNKDIVVQIVSGLSDLVNQLQNAPMSDLDLGVFKSIWRYFNPSQYTDFSIIGAASFFYSNKDNGLSLPAVGAVLPFARFISVVDEIVKAYGYTFETDIRDNVKDVVLPVVVPPETPNDYDSGYRVLKAENRDKSGVTFQFWKITQNHIEELLVPHPSTIERFRLFWRPSYSGTVTLKFETKKQALLDENGNEFDLRLTCVKNSNVFMQKTGFFLNFEENISCTGGDLFQFYVEPINKLNGQLAVPQYGDGMNYVLSISVGKYNRLPFAYKSVNISSSLGFDKQIDVLKAFILSFGLFMTIDPANRILRANSFNAIYASRLKNIDWSDKLDMSEFECEFHNMDFAQNNKVMFEDNTKQNIKEDTTLQISDSTLSIWKDFIKLPFEAGFSFGGNKIAVIPLINNDDVKENGEFSISETKPHLCVIRGGNYYISGGYHYTYRKVEHLRIDELREYYEPLFKRMLDNYKKITVKMLLSPNDIITANNQIPIYIKQLNGYFYVNAINNYRVGELADVELILI